MVVSRASGKLIASSLKQNTFLTLGVRAAGGSARDGGPEGAPRRGDTGGPGTGGHGGGAAAFYGGGLIFTENAPRLFMGGGLKINENGP